MSKQKFQALHAIVIPSYAGMTGGLRFRILFYNYPIINRLRRKRADNIRPYASVNYGASLEKGAFVIPSKAGTPLQIL